MTGKLTKPSLVNSRISLFAAKRIYQLVTFEPPGSRLSEAELLPCPVFTKKVHTNNARTNVKQEMFLLQLIFVSRANWLPSSEAKCQLLSLLFSSSWVQMEANRIFIQSLTRGWERGVETKPFCVAIVWFIWLAVLGVYLNLVKPQSIVLAMSHWLQKWSVSIPRAKKVRQVEFKWGKGRKWQHI